MSVSTGLGSAAWLVFERDVRLAFRRWQQLAHPVVFFVMVATLFPLALSPEPSLLRNIAPGVVWVAALLSSLLALDMLAKPGPDGTQQITAPLSLQRGQAFIGPVRLARLPNFTWE